jgi:glyoxalase family protein
MNRDAPPRILGLHHVTATVAHAQPDLDFHVGVLGLRLVKTTVNFDNHDVYHFYYGDERGSPSTLMTTFPYARHDVRQGVQGAGQITTTRFSVPPGAIEGWRGRLDAAGIHHEAEVAADVPGLVLRDPSGLRLALVEEEGDPRAAWTEGGVPPVPGEIAIRGLHSVTLTVRDAGRSVEFARERLGLEPAWDHDGRTRLCAPGDGRGAEHPAAGMPGRALDIVQATGDLPDAVNGLGTVHHVALAVRDDAAQLAFRERLMAAGVRVTEVRDRKYFRSIYFREPGGILYEIATMGPGFAVDEAPGELGRALRLPDEVGENADVVAGRLEPVSPPGF